MKIHGRFHSTTLKTEMFDRLGLSLSYWTLVRIQLLLLGASSTQLSKVDCMQQFAEQLYSPLCV